MSTTESSAAALKPARTLPALVRLSPEVLAQLSAAAAPGRVTANETGLLLGDCARGVLTVKAVRFLERPLLDDAFTRAVAERKADGLELLGWCRAQPKGGLEREYLDFHNSRFRRLSDVALLLTPVRPAGLRIELYARATRGPLSETNQCSSGATLEDAAEGRALEINLRPRIDEAFYLRAYELRREEESAASVRRWRSALRFVSFWRRPEAEQAATPESKAHFAAPAGEAGRVPDAVIQPKVARTDPFAASSAVHARSKVRAAAAGDSTYEPASEEVVRKVESGTPAPAFPPRPAAAKIGPARPASRPGELPAVHPEPRVAAGPDPKIDAPAREVPQAALAEESGRWQGDSPGWLRRMLWPLVIGLAVGGLTVGVAYLTSLKVRSGQGRSVIWRSEMGGDNIALQIAGSGDRLLLTWDRTSPLVRDAVTGSLEIKDGERRRVIALNKEEITGGAIIYRPGSADVVFRLQLQDAQGHASVGLMQSIDGAGAAPGAAASPPAPAASASKAADSARVSKAAQSSAAVPASAIDSHRDLAANRERLNPAEAGVLGKAKPRPVIAQVAPREAAVPAALGTQRATETPRGAGPNTQPREAGPGGQAESSKAAAREDNPIQASSAAQDAKPALTPKAGSSEERTAAALTTGPVAWPELTHAEQPAVKGAGLNQLPATPPAAVVAPAGIGGYVPPRPLRQVVPGPRGSGVMVYREVEVAVQVKVDAAGRVIAAQALRKGGQFSLSLEGAALTAAREWQFQPATLRGRAIASDYTIRFQFHPNRY